MPYVLLGPTVLFLMVFFAWPMIQALVLAFQNADGAWSLAPIERMTGDLRFGDAVKTTLLFAGVVIPLQTVLAMGMALLLVSGLRGGGFFLYLWAIPLGVSDLASGVVWLSIFTDRGYINSILAGLGMGTSWTCFAALSHDVVLGELRQARRAPDAGIAQAPLIAARFLGHIGVGLPLVAMFA